MWEVVSQVLPAGNSIEKFSDVICPAVCAYLGTKYCVRMQGIMTSTGSLWLCHNRMIFTWIVFNVDLMPNNLYGTKRRKTPQDATKPWSHEIPNNSGSIQTT